MLKVSGSCLCLSLALALCHSQTHAFMARNAPWSNESASAAQRHGWLALRVNEGTSTEDAAAIEEQIKGLVKNLFSMCAHIQNPELHSPSSFNQATLREQANGCGMQFGHLQLSAERRHRELVSTARTRDAKHKGQAQEKKENSESEAAKTRFSCL